jgi:hypothetical protein
MPPNHDPDKSDPLARYRTSLSVGILAASVNNKGYPTLSKASDSTPYRTSSASGNLGHSRVLNAAVIISVRKSGVHAGIACRPSKSPIAANTILVPSDQYPILIPNTGKPNSVPRTLSPKSKPSSVAADSDLDDELSCNEDDEYHDHIQNLSGSEDLSHVTLTTNPDAADHRYFTNVTGEEQCVLVEPGESHMSKVLSEDKHWEMCLQIP